MSKESNNRDLKGSLKATSLFGGTQVFSIIISIVKNKLIALLIGPVGIGIVELFNSTIQLINTSTNFSLSISAVRDVSVAYKSGNKEQFCHTFSLFTKVIWFTGLLGTIVCLAGSPLWSKLSFGNYDYTISFCFLSVILLFTQLNSGKVVLLQSTGNYKKIAAASITGNIIGLATAVPIYYFLKIDGIVVVLIISAVTAFGVTRFYAKSLNYKCCHLPLSIIKKEGGTMIFQGLYLSINYIFSALIVYVLRLFISNVGSVEILGLFSAAFLMVNRYVGMVFQSMSQEYYPRLSFLSNDNTRFNEAISNQIYLLLLIIGPLILFFLIFSEHILYLLYSEKFIGASLMMSLAMIGVVFQAPSYCMGFAFLAKGDNKAYLDKLGRLNGKSSGKNDPCHVIRSAYPHSENKHQRCQNRCRDRSKVPFFYYISVICNCNNNRRCKTQNHCKKLRFHVVVFSGALHTGNQQQAVNDRKCGQHPQNLIGFLEKIAGDLKKSAQNKLPEI